MASASSVTDEQQPSLYRQDGIIFQLTWMLIKRCVYSDNCYSSAVMEFAKINNIVFKYDIHVLHSLKILYNTF
jgi:hypothetical protein